MLADELPSSPPQGASPEVTIAYYKKQYEQLESELADFQASSQELEAELEKDVEAAEKRERLLQEKVESLGFEVEEWKTKYKQSKSEANAAQNLLQKEITTLRETNRSLQLTLRDIEVQNDDFERQARNTTSSLEDLESKYNVGIERSVMMDEEIKIGEQERENLRIETQRLRDELSDLKIEAEIMQDKLRKRQYPTLTMDIPKSPAMVSTPGSIASSPMISTPPDTVSISPTDSLATRTPPSPPISETSSAKQMLRTPINPPKSKLKLPTGNSSITPKPLARAPSSHIRSPRNANVATGASSATRTRNATPSVIRNVARTRAPATRGLPNSTSLTHIRSLTAQMQRLEQRVQSARSKLPAPVTTPPRVSPRSSVMGQNYMPPSVTIESRKRTTGSATSSIATTSTAASEDTPVGARHVSRISTSGISRLSFGPVPVPSRDGESRPSSRVSNNFVRADRPLSRTELARPASRASLSGRGETPLGHYSQSTISESRRPRSSIGGSYAAAHGHGHSQSVSHIDLDEYRELDFSTPSHRNRSSQGSETEIPPVPSGLPRRKSGVTGLPRRTRRTSHGPGDGSMAPPSRVRLSGVGETY